MTDSRLRSLLKSLSYRGGGALITLGIVWAITGELALGVAAGSLDSVAKTGWYYIHERIWVRLGRR